MEETAVDDTEYVKNIRVSTAKDMDKLAGDVKRDALPNTYKQQLSANKHKFLLFRIQKNATTFVIDGFKTGNIYF